MSWITSRPLPCAATPSMCFSRTKKQLIQIQLLSQRMDRAFLLSHIVKWHAHFRSITATLESNLDSKSKLYKDGVLQHIFLMNNFHYMVRKVKSGELRLFFGDEWIKEHIVKYKQHAMSYERANWNSVLSFLKDGDSPGLCSASKAIRGFTIAFEEVYKNQTGSSIPDPELREDLQISTSQKVIHAYRSFMGRKSSSISEKNIRHSPDDLQNYILDLFNGSPRILQSSRKKWSLHGIEFVHFLFMFLHPSHVMNTWCICVCIIPNVSKLKVLVLSFL